MAEKLQSLTSTLVVKLPADIDIPTYVDKPRIRKAILRTIIQTLQTKKMELVYVGPQLDSASDYFSQTEGIIVTVNVLNDASDFNVSQDVLLKRFKKALQFNNEHILIDTTTFDHGVYQRNIQIYIKSRISERPTTPAYTFATSSGTFSEYLQRY